MLTTTFPATYTHSSRKSLLLKMSRSENRIQRLAR